jgi:hypothetical protein
MNNTSNIHKTTASSKLGIRESGPGGVVAQSGLACPLPLQSVVEVTAVSHPTFDYYRYTTLLNRLHLAVVDQHLRLSALRS